MGRVVVAAEGVGKKHHGDEWHASEKTDNELTCCARHRHRLADCRAALIRAAIGCAIR